MITVDEITVDDFKDHFVRDFDYAIPSGETTSIYDCQKNYVMNADITKAFSEAKMNFNESLFDTDSSLKLTFLYLTAHYLVMDLQMSQQGPGSGSQFPVQSRSVGPVSESYSIPDWISKDPMWSVFATTRYGMKYISLVRPLLVGNVFAYQGASTPW